MIATLKALFIALWILACMGVAAVFRLTHSPRCRQWTVRACYLGIGRIMGLKIVVSGALSPKRPLLLVSNHSSYLDVVTLASLGPVSFTPKAEIAGWPLIGACCRLSDCVFIDRRASKTEDNRRALHRALADGALVSLFPEGTTSDGKRVLPFRSSYFALSEERFDGERLHVQPALVTYTHIRGLPVGPTDMPRLAWYGDMELVSHLRALLSLGPITARVTFLPPVTMDRFATRKEMARYCEEQIAAALHSR